MNSNAHSLAQDASLQAFVNCYLREVDVGTWYSVEEWGARTGVALRAGRTHVVEVNLSALERTIAFVVGFRSLVGRHALEEVYSRWHSQESWCRLDPLSVQLLLIDSVYATCPESQRRLELISRVIESHQVMALYLQDWMQRAGGEARDGQASQFIRSEQSVALGHWLHPTPKSRQGLSSWQHAHYCPELRGRFQLQFFAAKRHLTNQASLLDISAEELCRRLAGCELEGGAGESSLREDECLLPIHPLQAQWLLHQDHVRELIARRELRDLGRLGPEFTPTSSVRTVYCESADVMLKLSIPVKVTNSLRINLQSELGDSVWISRLIRACGLSERFPELRIIEDPAFITLTLPNREETGFEVIFRNNPFKISREDAQLEVHSIAALVQAPLPGVQESELSRLVRVLARSEGISLEVASRRWFGAYFRRAIELTISIYDRFGIALEAHQQNTLLDFLPSGLPAHCYYRDIQGLALLESFRDRLVARVPELARQQKVFEPDDVVQNGLGYYLICNHLYSVVNRFALDGLLDEETLLDIVCERLTRLRSALSGPGIRFIDSLLEDAFIPCKANLLTRIDDLDELQAENELAVYSSATNPIQAFHAARFQGSERGAAKTTRVQGSTPGLSPG